VGFKFSIDPCPEECQRADEIEWEMNGCDEYRKEQPVSYYRRWGVMIEGLSSPEHIPRTPYESAFVCKSRGFNAQAVKEEP
jgi:hypothetical protein